MTNKKPMPPPDYGIDDPKPMSFEKMT
jgi:hypothetical protein